MATIGTDHGTITITGTKLVDISLTQAYRMLLLPSEQLLWNSCLLLAKVRGSATINSGTVMDASFRETGRVTITYDEVTYFKEFTHVYNLKAARLLMLGKCRHRYEVAASYGKTMVTQTIVFRPCGVGRVFKDSIAKNFQKRIGECIRELEDHHTSKDKMKL